MEYAGWSMPVEYAGIRAEHNAVRTAAGIFDVGHMGEFRIRGSGAAAFLQYLTTNDVGRLDDGGAQYSALAYPSGTVVDDILVYRIDPEHYMLVVNAANIDKDVEWLREHNRFDADLTDISAETGLIAVQGPASAGCLGRLTDADLERLDRYHFVETAVAGAEGLLSRTGYTGEDGFEFYHQADDGPGVWKAVLDLGRPLGLEPAGLGARNTLRLEARLLLYGHDIDETTTLFEAGLGRIVRLDCGDFIGRDHLAAEKAAGPKRTLAGFEMLGRDIARDGYPVFVDGDEAGYVSSGSPSITLKKNIGLAYLPFERAVPGSRFEIGVRNRMCPAKVVPTPFYRRGASI